MFSLQFTLLIITLCLELLDKSIYKDITLNPECLKSNSNVTVSVQAIYLFIYLFIKDIVKHSCSSDTKISDHNCLKFEHIHLCLKKKLPEKWPTL